MSDGEFWLTVEQFGRLEPHLPRDTCGIMRDAINNVTPSDSRAFFTATGYAPE